MKTSKAGIELIKRWEGCKLTAYQDSVGVWTIGYGHTRTAKKGMTITQEQADTLLLEDITEHEKFIARYVNVTLSQGQYDALSSFVFNLGGGALQKSTLLKCLNAQDYQAAAKEFDKWVYAGGQKLNGLVKRRAAERRMFEHGI
ncbi:lysozyme [Pseudomonas sp. F1_0610]|uniref:lysozyme n=1 Tax=Pseudomonas sp. F1_0610 TaxID=3114284 RepID=UPI0039C2BAD9